MKTKKVISRECIESAFEYVSLLWECEYSYMDWASAETDVQERNKLFEISEMLFNKRNACIDLLGKLGLSKEYTAWNENK